MACPCKNMEGEDDKFHLGLSVIFMGIILLAISIAVCFIVR